MVNMKNKMYLEQRLHSRKTVKIPIQYRLVDDPKEIKSVRGKTALARDLSLEGMHLKVPKDKPVKSGDILRLDISLPKKGGHLFAFAEVAWANPKGAGLRLLQMPVEDRESLKGFLHLPE